MTKKQIIHMLKDIVKELDYDIFKDIFLEGYMDLEDQKEIIENLVQEVGRHMDIDSC